jgi:hypothetical protein
LVISGSGTGIRQAGRIAPVLAVTARSSQGRPGRSIAVPGAAAAGMAVFAADRGGGFLGAALSFLSDRAATSRAQG